MTECEHGHDDGYKHEVDHLSVGDENIIEGTNRKDTITGTSANDTINGGDGKDVIYGDTDSETILISTIENFDNTMGTARGNVTHQSSTMDGWLLSTGYSALDEQDFGFSNSSHNQVLELATSVNTSMSQSFENLAVGAEVKFSFDIALPEYKRVLGEDGVRVFWNGVEIGDYSASSYEVWETVNIDLTAGVGDGSNTLELVGIGTSDYWGAILDNLTVNVENAGGNDMISGGAGNDQIYGMAGRDWLIGGEGKDKLFGGEGVDTASYHNSASAVSVNLGAGKGYKGDAKGDRYDSIENVHGSAFDDTIKGDSGVNRLVGRDGDDYISAGSGDDYVLGGRGADTMIGGAGRDTAEYDYSTSGVSVSLLTGTSTGGFAEGDTLSGFENLYGSHFSDCLQGDDGTNRLNGSFGDDRLFGMDGNDILVGGHGADFLDGGMGDRDAVDYGASDTGVTVDLLNNFGSGGEAEGDMYANVEFIYGSTHSDVLFGDDGVNRIVGDDGDDQINGNGGNDYLIGGAGNDTITGGEGDDVFLYTEAFGDDAITDFAAGAGRTDRVWLDDLGFNSMADLDMSQQVDGTLIDLGAFGTITLLNLAMTDLVEDDFIF